MRRVLSSTLKKKTSLDNKVFVSTLRFRRAQAGRNPVQIKLIGIDHGDVVPLGIRTARILKRELSKEKGKILAEGSGRSMLPKEFTKRAIDIERIDPVSDFFLFKILPWHALPTPALGALSGVTSKYLKEFFVKVKRVDGLAPRLVWDELPASLERWRKLHRIPKEKLVFGLKLFVTTRSLLLASNIVKEAMEDKGKSDSLSVVKGSFHMGEIGTFLEKPDTAIRYLKKIEAALRPVSGTERIRNALNSAQHPFEYWKRYTVIKRRRKSNK